MNKFEPVSALKELINFLDKHEVPISGDEAKTSIACLNNLILQTKISVTGEEAAQLTRLLNNCYNYCTQESKESDEVSEDSAKAD